MFLVRLLYVMLLKYDTNSPMAEGKISGVFWGRLWISHPDLAKRIRYGKPVDTPVDMQNVYGNMDGMTLDDQRVGYTDYPFAENEA